MIIINDNFKIIKNNDDIIKLSVVKFLTVTDLFLKPVPSRVVRVYSVNTDHNIMSNSYDIILNSNQFNKCFFVQLTNQAVVISLCHSM